MQTLTNLTNHETWVTIKEWNDWLWVYTSMMNLVPSTLIIFIKLYQLAKKQSSVEDTKLNWSLSTVFKLINSYCFIYYIFDALSFYFLGKLNEPCYMAFMLHHIASIFSLACLYHPSKQLNYFEMITGAAHSYVLAFPKLYILQYIYFGCLVFTNVQLFRAPYNQKKYARMSLYGFPLAYIGLVMIVLFGCQGMMDATATRDL